MPVAQRRHLRCCETEPLQKTRGAAKMRDPSLELVWRKLLFESVSCFGHQFSWTLPLRPWLHILYIALTRVRSIFFVSRMWATR